MRQDAYFSATTFNQHRAAAPTISIAIDGNSVYPSTPVVAKTAAGSSQCAAVSAGASAGAGAGVVALATRW